MEIDFIIFIFFEVFSLHTYLLAIANNMFIHKPICGIVPEISAEYWL